MLRNKLNRNNLLQLALLGFVLTMPFAIKLNSIFVILILLIIISKFSLWQDIKDTLRQPVFVTLFIFYGLYILGIFFSSNTRAAVSELELKSTLLILPLAFTSARITIKSCNRYLKAFSAIMIIASLLSFALLLFKIFVQNQYRAEGTLLNVDWVLFSYYLPKQLDFHPPYFSMYTVMAAIIAAYFFVIYAFIRKNTSRSILCVTALLYLLMFAVLLSSRTALVAGIIILTIGFLSTLLYYRKIVLALLVLLFMAGTSVLVINTTPYLKQKLSSGTGMDQRRQMWQASLNLIKEQPVIGVGTGDVKDKLTVEYQKLGYAEGADNRMDPHNQYLQLLVAMGVIGLLVFLIYLVQLFYLSLSARIYLLTAFTLLIILCCITESILGTQKGLIFVSFFSALFVSPKQKNIPEANL